MSAPYLTVDTLGPYSSMPSADIAALDAAEPGFIDARIATRSSQIHSGLGKRYVRPFVTPVPDVVLGWLGAMVTVDMYIKRGTNPQDETIALIIDMKTLAESQIKEAADSVDGLWDIPLADSADQSAITKGQPQARGDVDPYEWMDRQAHAARDRGTRGFE